MSGGRNGYFFFDPRRRWWNVQNAEIWAAGVMRIAKKCIDQTARIYLPALQFSGNKVKDQTAVGVNWLLISVALKGQGALLSEQLKIYALEKNQDKKSTCIAQ
jgi:hypothetical protein